MKAKMKSKAVSAFKAKILATIAPCISIHKGVSSHNDVDDGGSDVEYGDRGILEESILAVWENDEEG
ncbi:hypothetical protein SUGI_0839650 [Cryptomeria japonica]|nr:hypothetical protein SUGI_0839650 [Cryptomeria japonica]